MLSGDRSTRRHNQREVMLMWAIRDDRTKRFYNGMDEKYSPPRPRLSRSVMKIYRTDRDALESLPDESDLTFELIEVRFTIHDRIKRWRSVKW